jgi:hypothetical protein
LDVGVAAEHVFDAAYASDWAAADQMLPSLGEAARALPQRLPKPELIAALHRRLNSVRASVRSRNRGETMTFANTITQLVDEDAGEFQRRIPYDALMLMYYGRQLEVGLTTRRRALLRRATVDLRATWRRLEPQIERRHPDEASAFTDIVVTLEGARRPADYAAPTRAELAEAHRIERLFPS